MNVKQDSNLTYIIICARVKSEFKLGKYCKNLSKNCERCDENYKCSKCKKNSSFNSNTNNCECNNEYKFSKKKNKCISIYLLFK